MSDLEWYLDVGGKQSGPHSAKEIVEMVRAGKIPATSQVTAARMNGDWVIAQDLIDAYDELYTKPALAVPIASGGTTFTPGPSDPNYTAPPRPTEQLEKSKIITLNREESAPDPTEALFHAIQAVREKATQKVSATAASSAAARDSFANLRQTSPRVPPQLLFIVMIGGILALTVFGVMKMTEEKAPEEVPKTAVRKAPELAPVPIEPSAGGLLNDQGGGSNAARTAAPVRALRPVPPRAMERNPVPTRLEPVPRGGGARYRDERDDQVTDTDPEIDDSDMEQNRELAEPVPVDPSQVPADRIIPEPGTIPGRGALPGADPNQAPSAEGYD